MASGRGSFVSAQQDVIPAGRKDRAVELINALVNQLVDLRFSYREIKSMVDLVVLEREEQLENLSIAVVDCSPEALNILYRQLGILSRINGRTILLDDLAAGAEPEKRLAGFDLILTTATHYSEVLGMAPGLKDRLLRVVVSPSQETIIHLAGLKPSQTIGILCESRQFLAIIKLKLDDLCLTNSVSHLFWPCPVERDRGLPRREGRVDRAAGLSRLVEPGDGPDPDRVHRGRRPNPPLRLPNRARLDGLPGRADQGPQGAMNQHTIVLGVIGSDCHSVGNKILDAFFSRAGLSRRQPRRHGEPGRVHRRRDSRTGADAILVSSLYGHGEIDCDGFRRRCVERGLDDILLYVGGNLVVGKTPREAVVREVRGHGVRRRVHRRRRPRPGRRPVEGRPGETPAAAPTSARGRRDRESATHESLEQHHDVDDPRETNRHRRLPPPPPGGLADLAHRRGSRSARRRSATSRRCRRRSDLPGPCGRPAADGRLLLQPRAGVALLAEHAKLLKYLETEGGADLLPTTIDAYTRQNRYEEAAKGIEKSTGAGRVDAQRLSGRQPRREELPPGDRERSAEPVQVRHGTPDARLLAEIALAGGFTSFEGGGISYNIPYAKNVPLRKSLTDWQYVDRLCGLYEEHGVAINREPFGPLTGTLVPPCIGHAVAILEGLLALEQGVRSITLGYGQARQHRPGHGRHAEPERAWPSTTSATPGFTDFELTTVFHQWMGGFPEDEAKAFAVIGWGTVVACLAGADKIIVKTPHEAMGMPTKEANAQGLKATRQIVSMLADQRRLDDPAVAPEADLIEREVRCILDKVFELGQRRREGRGRRGLRGRRAGRRLRPLDLLPGQGPAHARQRGLHPHLQPRRHPVGRRPGRLSPRRGSKSGPGRRPPRLLPDGHRRHLRHQQRPAGGKTKIDENQRGLVRQGHVRLLLRRPAGDQGRRGRTTASTTPARRVTPGFPRIRTAGESISVLLVLEDGQIAVGDCAAVQYSGAGGRDPLFLADAYLPFLEQHSARCWKGRRSSSFRAMARRVLRTANSTAGRCTRPSATA